MGLEDERTDCDDASEAQAASNMICNMMCNAIAEGVVKVPCEVNQMANQGQLREGCAGWSFCLANPSLPYCLSPEQAVGELVLVYDPGEPLHDAVGKVIQHKWNHKHGCHIFQVFF